MNFYLMRTMHECQRRFCSNIGMNHEEIKAVQETVKKSEEFDIRYRSVFGYRLIKLSNVNYCALNQK